MKIILSPAKKMLDQWQGNSHLAFTESEFQNHTAQIVKTLKRKKVAEIKSLMKLSDALAQLNFDRNQILGDKEAEQMPAGYAFQGEVYRGLSYVDLNENAQKYLARNLYILSGLYGILRPTDLLQAYRLEMGTKIGVARKKNLYEFWQATLSKWVNEEMTEGELLLNLASDEYSKALDLKSLKARIIGVDFMDMKDGKFKKLMVYFKQARGAMARYCAENNIQDLDEIKASEVMGYRYQESLSQENHLVFAR